MRRIALIIWLFLLPLMTCAAGPVYLSALRVEPHLQKTKLSFSLSDKTSGKVKYVPNPQQLVVELTDTIKLTNLNIVILKNENIKSYTTEILPNQGLRFIFPVTGTTSWTTQYSTPDEDGKVQLQVVIDSAKPQINHAAVSLKQKIQQDLLKNFLADMPDDQAPVIGRSRLERAKEKTAAQKDHTFVIAIDAGHGGKDPGAHGRNGTKEKDVVLSIAKLLAKEINSQPNMRAVLTRNSDYYVPLRERLRLARKFNADLFVAIHADAYFNNSATGASVYALSQHGATSEAARWLAQRDNYSELGTVELSALKDRSPMLRSVMIDLAQTTTIQDSIKLGNKILDALDNISTLHYSHVEQAPFMVLKSPDIPSVLVETGFISNPREEKRLATLDYQTQVADALSAAIRQYMRFYAKLRL